MCPLKKRPAALRNTDKGYAAVLSEPGDITQGRGARQDPLQLKPADHVNGSLLSLGSAFHAAYTCFSFFYNLLETLTGTPMANLGLGLLRVFQALLSASQTWFFR